MGSAPLLCRILYTTLKLWIIVGFCVTCGISVYAAETPSDDNCVVNNGKTGRKDQNCTLEYTPAEGALGLGKTDVKVILETRLRETHQCYSWRAVAFSTLSPYVQLYAPTDTNGLPHEIEFDNSVIPSNELDRCAHIRAVTITFAGHVEWVQLFADISTAAAPPLTDSFAPIASASSLPKQFAKKIQSKTEAPGATNVQVGWSPSFNGPQKVGVYSNLLYLLNIPNTNQDRTQWIGISSLIDRDNRGAQNPDSTINTITYMAFMPTRERHCEGEVLKKPTRGDLFDCNGVKIRPAIMEVKSGAEYALDTGALNQINSIVLHFPIAFFRMSSVTVTPLFGVEAGHNFVTEANLHASSAIFRWLIGTDASYRFDVHPGWLFGTKPYTLSGTFRARYPRTSEEFSTIYNNKNLGKVDMRTRIYARAELTVPLSKILSAGVLYQYGDLPPAFLFFGHTLSISLKATSPTDYEH